MADLKLPVTALISATPQDGSGWQLITQHKCGGFARETFNAYIYVLTILPTMQEVIDDVLFEQFLSDITKGLDDGVSDKQRAEFRSFLQRHGITVNDTNLGALKQAAYPMDASEKNLLTLTGKTNIKDINLDGMHIAILGDNCA